MEVLVPFKTMSASRGVSRFGGHSPLTEGEERRIGGLNDMFNLYISRLPTDQRKERKGCLRTRSFRR